MASQPLSTMNEITVFSLHSHTCTAMTSSADKYMYCVMTSSADKYMYCNDIIS